jgi:hypothetical protein
MRHLCLTLFLAACASPGSAQFRQAAPVPAPVLMPGAGAPVVGQPGTLEQPEEVPRSPYARELPATPEPGLWAPEAPRGSTGIPDARLLGVALPFIQDGERTERTTTLDCAERWRAAIQRAELGDKLATMREKERRCLAAMMFHHCWGAMNAKANGYRRNGVVDFTARRIGEKFKATANDFMARECGDTVLPTQQERWWMALIYSFNVGKKIP